MPKGETIGNVVIDGKGDGKGGAPEIATRKREKQSSRELEARQQREAETGPFEEARSTKEQR